MTASDANRRLATKIMAWAWRNNIRVTQARILRDLPAWATAYNAATAPERTLSVAEAAARLEVKEATVLRLLAPSSARLARRGNGVSSRGVETYRVTRAVNIARTRAVPGWRATTAARAA